MPRIRSLKIGFFTNETLCELSPWHRLLFEGLWILADREGRLEDRPRRIKAELFPYDELDVDTMLTDLADRNFVIRYIADGVPALAIPGFLKHQRPNVKEAPSSLAAPCCGEHEKGSAEHEKSQGEWDLGSGIRDRGMESSSAIVAEPVLMFPTVGAKGRGWGLSETKVSEWAALYPSLDILAEARKALAWLQANPGRQKTIGGMPKFLVNWFNRSNDDSRGRTASAVRVAERAPVIPRAPGWFCEVCDSEHPKAMRVCARGKVRPA